jgi:glucose 1-dehydrogenase
MVTRPSVCLTGVSAAGKEAIVDPGLLNRNMVLQNSVLFGSVNANRYHYELAADALAQADPGWLGDLITREVALDQWPDAYTRQPDDIKTILNFPAAGEPHAPRSGWRRHPPR